MANHVAILFLPGVSSREIPYPHIFFFYVQKDYLLRLEMQQMKVD